MPINTNKIQVGSYYLAGNQCDQLRKVVTITQDDKGRNRIVYVSKSIKISGQAFSPAATLANPALDTTYANACCKQLSATEVASLRTQNILLAGE